MAKQKNNRLSSDFLYTYTTEYNNIKSMLKNGIRHSLNQERLPYKASKQQNFIACFCDILPEQADYHKHVYGNYAIAFTKEWGIKNDLTPVRYIHKKSPGATANYVHIKNDIREARNSLKDGNQLDYFHSLLFLTSAREKGFLTQDSIKDEVGNKRLINHIKKCDESFEELKKKYNDMDLINLFNEWVDPILNILQKTVDELERRDGSVRIYQDDYKDIKDKILYDEREWRSVKFVAENDQLIYDEAIKKGFLPENYNIKFDTKDIKAIFVETIAEKIKLKEYIVNELNNLTGAEKLVFTF